jgi:NAD(P)-dependent dehydrogenase (short-subunit alcohol dehydrogenase family)
MSTTFHNRNGAPDPTRGPAHRPLVSTYNGRPARLYMDALARNRRPKGQHIPAAGKCPGQPVAIVTGGGRGIGRLAAIRLAAAGYAVGVIARSHDELAETARVVSAAGGCAAAITADVTDIEAARQVVRDLEAKLGPIDLLINNAGILGPVGPGWEVDLQAWWRTLEVNLLGTLIYTRAVLARMVERRAGRIINITSQAGAFRWPVVSAYSVSKAAVIKLTENLAIEARRHHVSIFSIHPGLLPIGLSETALDPGARPSSNEGRIYAWAQRQLTEGRGADPQDAIEQILRLASGRYDELSGRHLSVHDDLDQVLASIDDVRARELYVLGLHGLVA